MRFIKYLLLSCDIFFYHLKNIVLLLCFPLHIFAFLIFEMFFYCISLFPTPPICSYFHLPPKSWLLYFHLVRWIWNKLVIRNKYMYTDKWINKELIKWNKNIVFFKLLWTISILFVFTFLFKLLFFSSLPYNKSLKILLILTRADSKTQVA